MSNWSSYSRHCRLHRKAVPDGSYDFQRVLDEFQTGDEDDDEHEEHLDGDLYVYEDDFVDPEIEDKCNGSDFHYSDVANSQSQTEDTNTKDNDKNNNSLKICSCPGDLNTSNRRGNARDVVSPSGVLICGNFEHSLSANEDIDRHTLKLPQISLRGNNMGANCSNNFYDRREWHNVSSNGNSVDSIKHGKRSRLLKKRLQLDTSENIHSSVPSTCTCQHHNSHGPESESVHTAIPTIPKSLETRTSLSPNDISETGGTQVTSSRLSPSVDSAGHVKLSRVVGSGRARATANCDVSPHRLLTRRSYSPSGRTGSMDGASANGYRDSIRPRSQSWSNGKLGVKPITKSSSPRNSPTPSPVGIQKGLSSHSNSIASKSSVTKNNKTTPAATSQCPIKLSTVKVHDPNCPMHKVTESKYTSNPKAVSKTFEDMVNGDDDLAPVARRRAASESHTRPTRPRRLLPRTPDVTDGDQGHDHAHVHWADEEKGLSLSTSVFLSSIRPRSYSHGAMDSVPHRPILKKVAGF